MSDKMKGNIALLITAVVWGSGFIAQKLGGEAMPPITFNAVRQFFGAIVLLPLAIYSVRSNGYFSKANNSDSQRKYKINKMTAAAFACGGFLVLGSTLQQLGLQTVSAGKSGFISVTYVVFVPLLSIILGERAERKPVFCALLGLLGFAVMSLRFDGGMTKGDWLTLASAVAFSAQMLSIKHFVDKDNSLFLSVMQMAACGVIGTALGFLVEHPTLADFESGLPALIYTVFVPTIIGYPGQVIGQRHTDATTAALIMSMEAIFAAIFGALILGESMSAREFLGSAIIFAAVVIGQIEWKK